MQEHNKNSSGLPDVWEDCIPTTFPYRHRSKNAWGVFKQPVLSVMHSVYMFLLCVNIGGAVFVSLCVHHLCSGLANPTAC